jgi:hypothetical protein
VARQGVLTERFDEALTYALHAHDTQKRKGTDIPYAEHLLGVVALVLRAGGDEREAICALLHDAVEDAGGAGRLVDIRERFGDDVGSVVDECSEEKDPRLDWKQRKARYILGLSTCSVSALHVSLADKVHNARSILADYRVLGAKLWQRFNAPSACNQLWYYGELLQAYEQRHSELDLGLLDDFRRTLGELELLLGRDPCPRCRAGDVVPVLIGEPPYEQFLREQAGQLVLGGCLVETGTPDWACRVCGNQWRQPGAVIP